MSPRADRTGPDRARAWRAALSAPSPHSPADDTPAISDLTTLLAHMQPALNPGCYVFVTLPGGTSLDARQIVASIREAEGLSVVVAEKLADDLDLPIVFRAAWITLTVHSDLHAVGLTAAISKTLAQADIGCNVVAGVHHDHLFVPFDLADKAMDALRRLSTSANSAIQAGQESEGRR